MSTQPLPSEVESAVRRALAESWSEKTSVCYKKPESAPLSYGQCAPTAVVVFETFGGKILRTEATRFDGGKIPHFYNLIGEKRYDFTADQFDVRDYIKEFTYQDIPSSVEEAKTIMLPGQLDAMRVAFSTAFGLQHAG